MITLNKIGDYHNRQVLEIECLKADEKPIGTIDGLVITNGSKLHELDGDAYEYDEQNKTWVLQPKSSGGADGREIELQKTQTHIQWRYAGTEEWFDLVSLDEISFKHSDFTPEQLQALKGAKGDKGDPGTNGTNGKDGLSIKSTQINDSGHLILTFSDESTKDVGKVTGENGESAYQIAIKLGYKGTEQEWIESLKYDHSEEFTKLAAEVRNTASNIAAERQQITQNTNNVTKLKEDLKGVVPKQQGAENNGKILGIGADGMVVPVEKPSGGVDLDATLTSPDKAAPANMVGELKDKLKKQNNLFENTAGLNKCDSAKIEWSKNLSTSDGSEIVALESYGVTSFINVDDAKKVNFYTCDVSGIPVGGCFRTFFYTIDKALISYENNGDVALQQSISVPLNARYARFVTLKYGSRPNYMLVFNRDDTPNYETYKEVEPPNVAEKLKTIDAIKDGSNAKAGYALKIKTLDENGKPNGFEYGEASGGVKSTLVASTNKLNNSKIIEGYYGEDGAYKKASGFSTVSEMIPLDLKSKIINVYGCDTVGVPNNTWYSLVFFDESKEYIHGSGTINNSTGDATNTIYNIPSNAKYVIPSFLVAKKTQKYMLTFEETMYGYDEFNRITVPYDLTIYKLRASKWEGKKVLVIGDSISTSNYRGLQENGQNNPMWKKWDDILADRLGFEMTKDAISSSGFIVQPNTTTVGKDSICNRVDNYPSDGNYDMIIIFAGINDFLQGIPVGTVTGDKTANFISAVDYSVKTLIERFPKARLVAMLPLPIGMFSEFSQNDTSEYVNALIDRYDYYGVPYLDLAHNSGFRPHIQSFKDMFTLRGGSSSNPAYDGLHPNQDWDNNYLVPMVEDFINKFI